ncbi:hypothetical protein ACLD72_013710 [Paenibacillus sp. TH7-28]
MSSYFHEYDAMARVAAGRVEPVLSAVAGRYVGANPPRPPVYRVHSRRGSGYSYNKYYYKDELTWQLNDTHGIGIVLLAGIEVAQLLRGREVAGFGEC